MQSIGEVLEVSDGYGIKWEVGSDVEDRNGDVIEGEAEGNGDEECVEKEQLKDNNENGRPKFQHML